MDVASCLDRLAPYLRLDDVAIAGSVAMGRDRPADLDLVARSIGVVAPGVTRDFLVAHYHIAGPGVPKFMVQLVDPVTRIRVDMFPDLTGSIARARTATVGGHVVNLLSLEDVLDHKLQTLSKASPASPVDPKHARDARTIARLIGRTVPDVDPQSLANDVYGVGETDGSCARCELSRSASFPLAPRSRILDLLGWPTA